MSVWMLHRLICWSKNSEASIISFWMRGAREEAMGQSVILNDGLPFSRTNTCLVRVVDGDHHSPVGALAAYVESGRAVVCISIRGVCVHASKVNFQLGLFVQPSLAKRHTRTEPPEAHALLQLPALFQHPGLHHLCLDLAVCARR